MALLPCIALKLCKAILGQDIIVSFKTYAQQVDKTEKCQASLV
jgi:hypothetical protein